MFGATSLTQTVALNCADWTDPAATPETVTHGVVGYTDERWHAAQRGACATPAHVICAQQ